jgi:hypothetical protein
VPDENAKVIGVDENNFDSGFVVGLLASSRASLAPTGFVSTGNTANDTTPVGARLAREGVRSDAKNLRA